MSKAKTLCSAVVALGKIHEGVLGRSWLSRLGKMKGTLASMKPAAEVHETSGRGQAAAVALKIGNEGRGGQPTDRGWSLGVEGGWLGREVVRVVRGKVPRRRGTGERRRTVEVLQEQLEEKARQSGGKRTTREKGHGEHGVAGG